MKESDFLKLNLLEHNDYAGHWDIPVNENFSIIDEELDEIAEELLKDPKSPYSGALRGSMNSLEERLNVSIGPSGVLDFNSGDLENSRYSLRGSAVSTNKIADRMRILDSQEFVNDQLHAKLSGDAGHKYIKRRKNRLGAGDDRDGLRYATGGVGVDSIFYRQKTASDCFSQSPGGEKIEISNLGLFQLGGHLYMHTRTAYLEISPATEYWIFLAATSEHGGAQIIDCQLTRDYTKGTLTTGKATKGQSKFYCDGIGNDILPRTNNVWLPNKMDILRIKYSGKHYDYQIKDIAGDSLEIYGQFDQDFDDVEWWIYDFSQPNIFSVAITDPSTSSLMDAAYSKNAALCSFALIHRRRDGQMRASFFDLPTSAHSRYKKIPVPHHPNGMLRKIDDTTEEEIISIPLADVSITSVVKVHLVSVESSEVHNMKQYYTTIDPTRNFDIDGEDYILPSYSLCLRTAATKEFAGICDVGTTDTAVRITHKRYDNFDGSGWARAANSDYILEDLFIIVEMF